MPRGAEGAFNRGEETRKLNPCATRDRATLRGKQMAQEVYISQLGCDSLNVYINHLSIQAISCQSIHVEQFL